MQNIEIKAVLRDRSKVESRLSALGARRLWTHRQRDTFFDVPSGWLKIREVEGKPPEVISYVRSTTSGAPRASNYDVLLVEEAEPWKRLLGRVLSAGGAVEKERTLWIYEHTRVHLDSVGGLGEFIELETVVDGITQRQAAEETQRVVAALGVESKDLISVPYKELHSGSEGRSKEPAG